MFWYRLILVTSWSMCLRYQLGSKYHAAKIKQCNNSSFFGKGKLWLKQLNSHYNVPETEIHTEVMTCNFLCCRNILLKRENLEIILIAVAPIRSGITLDKFCTVNTVKLWKSITKEKSQRLSWYFSNQKNFLILCFTILSKVVKSSSYSFHHISIW